MNPPTHIDFRALSKQVPPRVPVAVQKATTRLVANRLAAAAQVPEWEELRQAAHDVRLHTIVHLDEYLAQVERAVAAAGGHFHRARDAAEANAIVIEIARRGGVKLAVKSKSMATEEIELNHALEGAGIRPVETDVGEFIIQLAHDRPSHLIGPTLHMSKEEMAALFARELGVDAPPEPRRLMDIAREQVRQAFLQADMGISGANLVIAETGTVVLVTNEGNGRLTTTLPDIHVAIAGIDKLIPDWNAAAVLLRLLARSGTGQRITCHTSFITGPRRSEGENGPREFHLVLVDNGRSAIAQDPETRETLLCIRCGACLNVCPVYNQVGGHTYGSVYSGPIGAILTPQLSGLRTARDLPFASTLCGACVDACPVKIPIPKILLHLREEVAESEEEGGRILPSSLTVGARLAAFALRVPFLYRLGARLGAITQTPFRQGNWLPKLPAPLNRWTQTRPLPAFRPTFREWWRTHQPTDTAPGGKLADPEGRSEFPPHPAETQPDASVANPGAAPLDDMDRLLAEINRLSGNARRVDVGDLDRALKELVESEGIRRAALWTTPGLAKLRLAERLHALGVELVPKGADKAVLAEVDLGVTEVDLALAETGSLGLYSDEDRPRAISILPRVHLAFVRPPALRADLGQMLESARRQNYMAVVSGLSRTSDIEFVPVLGAHGPLALYVWAME